MATASHLQEGIKSAVATKYINKENYIKSAVERELLEVQQRKV